MQPAVDIIVVSYNSRKHLQTMLPGVLRTAYPNFRVVLVDNASHDGSAEFVEQNFPSVRVLRNAENTGFARANNRALEETLSVGADYAVLLNPDVEVLDAAWLARAVEVAESNSEVGMVGFHLVHDAQAFVAAAHPAVEDVALIDGCALLMRTAMLRQIGIFDPGYFLYGEEGDLEFRARAAGYRLQRINVPMYHEDMGSAKATPASTVYYAMWGGLRLRVKTRGLPAAVVRSVKLLDVACNPFPFSFHPDNMDDVRLRMAGSRWLALWLWCRAVARTLVHLPEMYRTRRHERRAIAAARRQRAIQSPEPAPGVPASTRATTR